MKTGVNKNFPNYTKYRPVVTVVQPTHRGLPISIEPGPNRKERRTTAAFEVKWPYRNKIKRMKDQLDEQTKMKRERIEARHEENRGKSRARKLAAKIVL